MPTYRVTRTYQVKVPEGEEYDQLVKYYQEEDPGFFEDPRNLDPEIIAQQMPYWLTYSCDAGNMTDLAEVVDATAKEVKNEQVPSER